MTNWNPDIKSTLNLLQRVWLPNPTTGTVIIAPAGAGIVRASACGAGGSSNTGGGVGHGAAFARVTATCTPGESFTGKVGNAANAKDAGSSAGDSELLRTTGSISILLAKRGTATGPGLATGCTGDTKRNGNTAAGVNSGTFGPTGGATYNYAAGGCPGDLDDDFSLGIGGPNPVFGIGYNTIGAMPGCGGVNDAQVYKNVGSTYIIQRTLANGHGLMCVEFYRTDPGYGL